MDSFEEDSEMSKIFNMYSKDLFTLNRKKHLSINHCFTLRCSTHTFQYKNHFLGIPQVVLLTQIDKICEGLQWDVSKTFSIPAIEDLVDKAADLVGLPRAHILPVKNYEREMELRQDINILALLALRQILNFADDYLANY